MTECILVVLDPIPFLFPLLPSLSSIGGFNRVFSMERLQTFSPDELRLLVCGEQSPSWTRSDLLNYTEPKFGYTKER